MFEMLMMESASQSDSRIQGVIDKMHFSGLCKKESKLLLIYRMISPFASNTSKCATNLDNNNTATSKRGVQRVRPQLARGS